MSVIVIFYFKEGGMLFMITLKSERLVLRNWNVSDIDDFHEISSNKKVSDLAGFRLKTSKEDSFKNLERFIDGSDDSKWKVSLKELDQLVFWAIELKESKKAIGWIELCEATWKPGNKEFKYAKEIGFVLSEECWGKGFMPEAITTVLDYLFNEEEIEVVVCSHFINNCQSEKAMRKCGFTYCSEDEEEKYYYITKNNI
jgi:RimJ/RimL family protein N-acetyltransferase